jgi:hypothetical protein
MRALIVSFSTFAALENPESRTGLRMAHIIFNNEMQQAWYALYALPSSPFRKTS